MSKTERPAATQSSEAGGAESHGLDEKALTTAMAAFEEAPGVWTVMSQREHTVANVAGEFACDCLGFQFGHQCYHVRRLRFELGIRDIPDDIPEAEIDDMFREWIDPIPTTDCVEPDEH